MAKTSKRWKLPECVKDALRETILRSLSRGQIAETISDALSDADLWNEMAQWFADMGDCAELDWDHPDAGTAPQVYVKFVDSEEYRTPILAPCAFFPLTFPVESHDPDHIDEKIKALNCLIETAMKWKSQVESHRISFQPIEHPHPHDFETLKKGRENG